jgi:hypothetical protein
MRSSENDSPNKQATGNDVKKEADIYEDGINLIAYFRVLWKRKWLVLVTSVLPPLVVGLVLFLGPRRYMLTYTYDIKDQCRDQFKDQFEGQTTMDVSNWNLDEKNYNVLLERFYSEENLSRIIVKLQQEGFSEYAELISNARGAKELEKLVKFEVLPPYIDLAEVEETDPTELEKIRQLKALLLNVTITGSPRKDISKISSVIRDNLENIIPVYLVAEQLNVVIRRFRAKMADIEEGKFALQLALKNGNSILAKLKNIKVETLDKTGSDIMLQFDVGGKSEYLPIGYQIQAAESRVIQLEETIKDNERKYKYYRDLLSLNERLFVEVKNKASSDYTIQQFRLFLLESAKETEKEELKDYLNSYIKRIENRIATSTPIIENPSIYAISKGTVKKSVIVFAIALVIAVCVAFLLEGLKRSEA